MEELISDAERATLAEYMVEVVTKIRETGGNVSMGYTPDSVGGQGRWQSVITWGNPGGRDTLTAIGVGQSFIEALTKSVDKFREG